MTSRLLVIDQGTTSTRAIVFDEHLAPLATAQREFAQIYPRPGWVEHEPEALWDSVLGTAREVLARAGLDAAAIAGIGIANQRETTVVWDRETGRAIHNAVVWQDRRTVERCEALDADGHAPLVAARSGLRLDPYFSATKIGWILDAVPGAREAAERGRLAFGTIDGFLLWRLTEGRVHAIDATNASRTLLCNIATGEWDDDLLRLFDIPRALLPDIRDSATEFGTTALLGAGPVAIRGMAGDQQAALIGQGCFGPGAIKATYGTGGFILLNTGDRPVPSRHALLTTIAWQRRGQRRYALEGSIFSAGTAVQWLRDGIGLVDTAPETGRLAALADPAQPVFLVPAFTGLGAPHWDSRARATISGITRGTTRRELARATLESVGFQTRDLLGAMREDFADAGGDAPATADAIRVDGGMAASDWTMQFLADMLDAPVDRPACLETTALGAAYLAALQCGLCPEPDAMHPPTPIERRFTPSMPAPERATRYRGWRRAVRQALHEPSEADE
ncbi:MAG: glycerol kinase GlpK [Janthinobacterium lividum]